MDFITSLLSSFFMKVVLVVGASGFIFIEAMISSISAVTGIAVH
jgi:hypothetical protein